MPNDDDDDDDDMSKKFESLARKMMMMMMTRLQHHLTGVHFDQLVLSSSCAGLFNVIPHSEMCCCVVSRESRGFRGEPSSRMPPPPPPRAAAPETRTEIVQVDDLLAPPSRFSRPDHIVVIIRGPPGAGKTYVSKLLKVTIFCC